MASSKIYQQMLKAEGECLDPCLVSNYLRKIPSRKFTKGKELSVSWKTRTESVLVRRSELTSAVRGHSHTVPPNETQVPLLVPSLPEVEETPCPVLVRRQANSS